MKNCLDFIDCPNDSKPLLDSVPKATEGAVPKVCHMPLGPRTLFV